jgi:hypothetical protein
MYPLKSIIPPHKASASPCGDHCSERITSDPSASGKRILEVNAIDPAS